MQKNRIYEILGNAAFLIWSTLCLMIFMYFPGAISHMQGATLYDVSSLMEKLSRISIATYLLDALISSLGMAFYGVSCVSLGMGLSNIFHLEKYLKNNVHPQASVLIPTSFLIGNATFSLVFLAMASLWSLTPVKSIVLLSLGVLSGLTKIMKLSIPTARSNTGNSKVVVFLSVIILAISLFQSSARISYDASAVYFSNAKLTALEQHAGFYMENTFVASIFHSIIQFSAVMQVFGDQSARMISWLFGAANIAFALAIARHAGASVLARRILPALILTSTAFLDLMGDGKVDLISSAYSLAAVYWMIIKEQEKNQNQFLYYLSGCFIGFACILRPYNAFLLGVFVLAQTIQKLRVDRLPILEAVRQIAWMALGAVGFAIYHLLINKILLGSPFAFWSIVTRINPVDGPWGFKPETVWIERLLYPIIVTFKNSPSSLGSITPLVLVFLPSLAIRDIRKHVIIPHNLSRLTISAGMALYAWIILFFTIAEIRYVIFLWIILFIPLAEVAASALNTEIALIRNAIKGCVVLLMGFILMRSAYISVSKYAPLDAEGNPQCIGDVFCGHYSSINKIADEGERVLTLSAFRYYLRTDLFACSTTKEEYGKLRVLSYTDTEAFWREVYRMGYSYVAFEEDYATRQLIFSDAPFENLPDWIELSEIITTSQSLRIVAYRFDVTNPPINAETVCKQDGSGIWRLQSR